MQPKPAASRDPQRRSYMKAARKPKPLSIPLDTPPAVAAQLRLLQQAFADVCNAIAPVVRETRCWNRVTLHHLLYRSLRERFPQLGSQLICNAIYSVSRTCRTVFQTPASPFNISRLGDRPLPLMRFAPIAPVYFDKHTLSIRDGIVSMLTLNGRIRFRLSISEADEQRFRQERLREIVLLSHGGQFVLRFVFAADEEEAPPVPTARQQTAIAELPEYVALSDEDAADQVTELGEVT